MDYDGIDETKVYGVADEAGAVNVTWFGDKLYFNKDGMPHVAFIINHYDDAPNKADLVYYCPVAHAWQEAVGVTMGPADGQFSKA